MVRRSEFVTKSGCPTFAAHRRGDSLPPRWVAFPWYVISATIPLTAHLHEANRAQ